MKPGRRKRAEVSAPKGDAVGVANESAVLTEEIEARVRHRAYELWVQRGYEHGRAIEDWLQAEKEVTASIFKAAGSNRSAPRRSR